MGTQLQARGMPAGISPEMFGLERPDILRDIHADYFAAGSRVVTTNTFGGSRFKLDPSVNVRELNAVMARAAREAADAAGSGRFVAGSMGPTGHFLKPLGDLDFEELVDAFREQARGLADGGADLILIETQFDIAEARAAVVAVREATDLPVGVSMTFENCVSLTGTSPLTFVDVMQNMGVDLIATNCSAGPEQIMDVVRAMLPRLDTPLLVEPNAGLPELDENGNTVFRLPPEPFAEQTARFVEMGAVALGGCCGSSPEHMRQLSNAVQSMRRKPLEPEVRDCLVVTSRSFSVCVKPHLPFVVIGERINPTGKEKLTAELQAGQFMEAQRFAEEQITSGAGILDVNVGAAMVDEAQTLPRCVQSLVGRFQAPLCIDSTNPEAVAAAVRAYPASPLVNSISGEPGRMEQLGPLCRDFGAPFILLPLEGRKLPVSAQDRIRVIEKLLEQADAMGIPRRLVMVDVLALTVSSKADAARSCLETIRYCTDTLGLPTVMGLSNISFGLPARELLNSTFLTLCMGAGMTSCIANPNSSRLRESLAASEVLLNRDPQAEKFIASYADWKPGSSGDSGASGGRGGSGGKGASGSVEEAVVKGDRDNILSLVEKELENGADAFALVNDRLIPAITEVGEKYERREYFLPQLILSAETMQRAFGRLEPLLEMDSEAGEKPVVIMATVEGDIHDIGKNIVCLMLKNHGFNVIDLGKDVAAEAIVDRAVEENARCIGLSALMTTTMVRMEDTLELLRERGEDIKVFVGGAVVTQEYADSIGAHGYAEDAVEAVRCAKELSGLNRRLQ